MRLMVVFLLSGLVNQVAKHLAAQPRPFPIRPAGRGDRWSGRVWSAQRPHAECRGGVGISGLRGPQEVGVGGCRCADGADPVVPDLSRSAFPDRCAGRVRAGRCGVVALVAIRHPARRIGSSSQETIHQLILITAMPALAMAAWPTEDMVTGGGTMVGIGAGLVLERRLVGFDVAGTVSCSERSVFCSGWSSWPGCGWACGWRSMGSNLPSSCDSSGMRWSDSGERSVLPGFSSNWAWPSERLTSNPNRSPGNPVPRPFRRELPGVCAGFSRKNGFSARPLARLRGFAPWLRSGARRPGRPAHRPGSCRRRRPGSGRWTKPPPTPARR